MATAKKLPSGSWRVRVFSHYEYVDGKKKSIYESFTCDDPSYRGKKEAERMAAEWSLKQEAARPENITVYDAIQKYIDAKAPVLSPRTVAMYKNTLKNHFSDIGQRRIRDISNTIIQVWIGDLSKSLSPKSVRNVYGLLYSALDMFCPEFRISITLPQKTKPQLYTPSDNDITVLLNHIKGTELEIAVLLAAFGPMRRGEICALESTDIHGNVVTVDKNMVTNENYEWIIKSPKTTDSIREIEYPDFVIDKLKGIEGRIVKATPDQITNRFRRAVKSAGLPHFRFHDLRHYSASIMHAIGVPDQYIMARGGWKTDAVMKTVYRNVIDLEAVKQTKNINKHFESICHDI